MRASFVALACLILGLSLAPASAQTPSAPTPVVSISPALGGSTASHQIRGEGFPANAFLLGVLFDPSGKEIILRPLTDGNGTFALPLVPPSAGWHEGLYRVAIALGDGRSVSATFSASDGLPHLYAQPYLPSPTSAFNFVGTGLTPNTALTAHLWLTGGNLGERDLPVTTDAGGNFSIYAWPEEMGTPFFPAGQYRVELTGTTLSVSFWLRERPNSATIDVAGHVQPQVGLPISFSHYGPARYLWAVYAGPDGKVGGEFLVGPTNGAGDTSAALAFRDLGPGRYYIATPYDWGETTFTMVEPTPTTTARATATPSPTPTATTTPSKKSTTKSKKTCKKGKNDRKRCKKR